MSIIGFSNGGVVCTTTANDIPEWWKSFWRPMMGYDQKETASVQCSKCNYCKLPSGEDKFHPGTCENCGAPKQKEKR